MIELTLPWPPSINHYYGTARNGRKYLRTAGRVFRREVFYACKQDKVKKMEGPLKVTLIWYPPNKRKRDIDNYDKALLDALKYGGCYVDDSQIKERNAVMSEFLLGRVDVRIEPCPDVMVCKPWE